jgi:arabinogalactan oligomer/maltooligosaccharide transport system permease protein
VTTTHKPTVAAFITPALIGILLVNVIPILYSVYISLTNRNGPARFAEGRYQVTGFDNYNRLLSEPDFYLVLWRTVVYALVCVSLFFAVGLLFAVILNNPAIKGRTIWRTFLILPWAVPYWITALVWKFLFHSEFGPINQVLRLMGLNPPAWLLEGTTAYAAIVIINLWLSFPFFTLILLGGLQAIPEDLYEAADMDGAPFWLKFWAITLPLLRPVAVPAIILSVITTLKIFETIYLVTGGGPTVNITQPGATEVLMVWAYRQGFQDTKRFGLVGAFSVVVFLILLAITLIYTRATRATRAAYD